MEALLTADNLFALLTLTAMEIVLGIDNIVFLAIVVGKLPTEQQPVARRVGLLLAGGVRIGLLIAIAWVMRLKTPLFSLFDHSFSGRDLILILGGGFLIFKATWEIYEKLEVQHDPADAPHQSRTFALAIVQIVILDIIFSLDSVITAVGMADVLAVMIAAIVIAVFVMLAAAASVSRFVENRPSVKILALSFLLLIGVMLVAEGMGNHINKGYIYSAMAFSLFVEVLNMRYRKHHRPLDLHGPDLPPSVES